MPSTASTSRSIGRARRIPRDCIDLDVSTLADHVGAATTVLKPLYELIRCHVFAAERVHSDDTTVPALAPGKTITGRLCSRRGSSSSATTRKAAAMAAATTKAASSRLTASI